MWASRYKLKQKDDDNIENMEKHGPPLKVVWYLSRMKHLFANPNDVKNLIWHANKKNMMACTGIQTILLNGKNLMTSFPSFVKSQEIFDLVYL